MKRFIGFLWEICTSPNMGSTISPSKKFLHQTWVLKIWWKPFLWHLFTMHFADVAISTFHGKPCVQTCPNILHSSVSLLLLSRRWPFSYPSCPAVVPASSPAISMVPSTIVLCGKVSSANQFEASFVLFYCFLSSVLPPLPSLFHYSALAIPHV